MRKHQGGAFAIPPVSGEMGVLRQGAQEPGLGCYTPPPLPPLTRPPFPRWPGVGVLRQGAHTPGIGILPPPSGRGVWVPRQGAQAPGLGCPPPHHTTTPIPPPSGRGVGGVRGAAKAGCVTARARCLQSPNDRRAVCVCVAVGDKAGCASTRAGRLPSHQCPGRWGCYGRVRKNQG